MSGTRNGRRGPTWHRARLIWLAQHDTGEAPSSRQDVTDEGRHALDLLVRGMMDAGLYTGRSRITDSLLEARRWAVRRLLLEIRNGRSTVKAVQWPSLMPERIA